MTNTIRVDLSGMRSYRRMVPNQLADGVAAVALEGERYVKQQFNTSPPGRTYGNHTASQPGYPPNVDTGKLRNETIAQQRGPFTWAIASLPDYAAHLEYGTKKMAARPFMAPTARWLEGEVGRIFTQVMR